MIEGRAKHKIGVTCRRQFHNRRRCAGVQRRRILIRRRCVFPAVVVWTYHHPPTTCGRHCHATDLVPSLKHLRTALPWRQVACPPPAPFDQLCPLLHPEVPLPAWVADDPLVQDYRALIGALPWAAFPERPCDRRWPGPQPDPRAPFVAAYLIKLHEGKRYMSELRRFLIAHPALVWWLGFARVSDPAAAHGFDVAQSVPKPRHFSTVLRDLPNDALQFLLSASIQLLKATLPPDEQLTFGDTIAGDTQALLAWVKENNPKQYIKEGRLDKTKQPKGDNDCKLGVKHRRNHAPHDADGSDQPTPASDAKP